MVVRKRWPARNTDELARHVARNFPEITRQQVMVVMQAIFQGVLTSLEAQVQEGVDEPSVTIRYVGVFSLRRQASVRRHHLTKGMQEIPERWRLVFKPSGMWYGRIKRLPTRTTVQELSGQTPALESAVWPASSDIHEEEGPPDLPDLSAAD